MSSSRILSFFLLTTFQAIRTRGQQEAATPLNFYVPNGGTFMCQVSGDRCTYYADRFSGITKNGGQSTPTEEGTAWAAIDTAMDSLVLGDCIAPSDDYCYITCNAGCNCTLASGGGACESVVSRAPVPAPPSLAPVPQTCAHKQNTEQCGTLMRTALAPGNEFDCYNFCGGVFISTCDFYYEEGCGNLTCTNATADGTVSGLVLGCTDEDRNRTQGNTGTGGTGSVAPSLDRPGTVLAVIVAFVSFLWMA